MIFEVNGAVLNVYGASAAAKTNHIVYDDSTFEASVFISGVIDELDEAIGHGVQDDENYFIKIGPGTMAALWAKGFVDAEKLPPEGARISDVQLTAVDGNEYAVDIEVDETFDGAGGFLGDVPVWQAVRAA